MAAQLDAGGLLLYPTETVYGLGCALEAEGLRALTRFKGARPFLLLVEHAEQLRGLRWTPAARALAQRFWPGPLTLVLESAPGLPPEVVGPDGGVAVRISPHPAVASVLEAAGGPVTSTSANLPGEAPASEVDAGLEAVADATRALLLDGGRLPPGRPSTIVRCGRSNRLIRPGAVSREAIQSVVELE